MTRIKSTSPAAGADHTERMQLERLVFFSDAVFAIAITLLALEIRLPAGEGLLSDAELAARLAGLWHRYLAYFISFMVIGVFWMGHHRKFRFIRRVDGGLLTLNLLMLMSVAFLPFPSAVISEYPGRAATTFYAASMMLPGILLAAVWWYASRNGRLVDADLDPLQRRRQFIRPLMPSLVFLLSIGIAGLDADAAKFAWMLIIPVSWFVNQE